MEDFQIVYRTLVGYFKSECWSVDVEKGEAILSSGYGSGPAVIDLNALATKITEAFALGED